MSVTTIPAATQGPIPLPIPGFRKEQFSVTVEFTPELAFKFLEANNINRVLHHWYAAKIAKDMEAGEFHLTHQGIAVDKNGFVIDGQHRLWAVILSGKTILMMVTYNVTKAALLVIDRGIQKSTADIIKITGHGDGKTKSVATLRSMFAYSSKLELASEKEFIAVWDKFREGVEYATLAFTGRCKKATASAPIRGVVARAWYTVDRVRLQEFVEVMKTGQQKSEKDVIAIKLREILTGEQDKRGLKKLTNQDIYQRTERALWLFLRDMTMSKLIGTPKELFPLKDEPKFTRKTFLHEGVPLVVGEEAKAYYLNRLDEVEVDDVDAYESVAK